MNARLLALGIGSLSCVAVLPLHAQVPQIINYQGRVVVGTTNFNGSGQFKFAFVNANGSTTYWSNDGSSTSGSEPTNAVSLSVASGLYSVLLGDTTVTNMTVAIPASVFNNSDVRLRVWFNDGTHGSQLLAPDQRVVSVGYAVMAANVPDGAITSAKIANGAVGSTQIDASIPRLTGANTFNGNNYFTGGSVGIGTTTPGAPLEIKSSSSRDLNLNSTNPSGAYATWQLNGSDEFFIGKAPNVSANGLGYDIANTVPNSALSLYSWDTNGYIRFFTGGLLAGNERMRITSAGKIGIGNTNPLGTLDVIAADGARMMFELNSGELYIQGPTGSGNARLTLSGTGTSNTTSIAMNSGGRNWLAGVSGSDNFPTTAGRFFIEDNTTTPAIRFLIDQNGKVGIGTTSPFYQLDVQTGANSAVRGIASAANTTAVSGLATATTGTSVAGDFQISAPGGEAVQALSLATSGTNYGLYAFNASTAGFAGYFQGAKNYFSGKVGIGTTNPFGTLEVRAPDGATMMFELNDGELYISGKTAGSGARMTLNGTAPSGTAYGTSVGFNSGGRFWSMGATGGDNFPTVGGSFYVKDGTAGNDIRMLIDATGKVGIGTTAPATALDVNGTVTASVLSGSGTSPLDLKANGARVLRLNFVTGAFAPNIIGGDSGNSVPNSVYGGTVSGGGSANQVNANFGTVGGGSANAANGQNATVPGGGNNTAAGDFSFAAGRQARANHPGAFVWGDLNFFDFTSAANNEFAARATGGVRLVSAIDGAGTPTAGVYLAPGGTSWGVVSDRNAKKNFAPLNEKCLLEKLAHVPVQQWNYKWEPDDAVPHIGPTAQDFKHAFYPGRDDTIITTLEADGVALAAIQGLYQVVEAKDAEIGAMHAEIEKLRRELASQHAAEADWQKRVSRIEQAIAAARSATEIQSVAIHSANAK